MRRLAGHGRAPRTRVTLAGYNADYVVQEH